jgi:microcystin-dependent protein
MTYQPIRIAATRAVLSLALLTAAAPLHAQLVNPHVYSNAQPSLGLTYFLDQTGFVRMTAADFVPEGFGKLDGDPLLISNVSGYFSRVVTTWGGNGTTTVGVPDAVGRVIVGAAAGMALGSTHGADEIVLTAPNFPVSPGGSATPFDNRQPGVVMRYAIRTSGIFPSIGSSSQGMGVMGAVVPYAGVAALPTGWAFAEGQVLPINQNQALFALLGTMYGGNGTSTFALPDLRGRTPIGTGNGISLGQVSGSNFTTLTDDNVYDGLGVEGAPVSNHQATLGLSFLLASSGAFPQRGAQCACSPTSEYDNPFVGEVTMYAWQGTSLSGQLMRIAQNTALFSLLGTNFGGDGKATFALPDLQGRVVVGARDGAYSFEEGVVGARYGNDTFTVLPEPGTAVLTLVGLGGLLAVGRRRLA